VGPLRRHAVKQRRATARAEPSLGPVRRLEDGDRVLAREADVLGEGRQHHAAGPLAAHATVARADLRSDVCGEVQRAAEALPRSLHDQRVTKNSLDRAAPFPYHRGPETEHTMVKLKLLDLRCIK